MNLSSMKSYGLTERKMKYLPLKPVSKDNRIYWYIGFLLVFCIVATILNNLL